LRSATARPRACTRAVASQSAVVEIALCDERLLAPFELVKIVFDALEKVVDFWPDF
jgi:hypothetical protein